MATKGNWKMVFPLCEKETVPKQEDIYMGNLTMTGKSERSHGKLVKTEALYYNPSNAFQYYVMSSK